MIQRRTIQLFLGPGDNQIPPMRHVAIDLTTKPDTIILVLAPMAPTNGASAEATMSVPLSKLDAAALLHGLRALESQGLIPVVPEIPRAKQ